MADEPLHIKTAQSFPNIMQSDVLLKIMHQALIELRPLFEIRQSEYEKFPLPELKRNLQPDIHPDHNRLYSGYSTFYKFIYIPEKDRFHVSQDMSLFSKATIYHEMGHHFHNILNPCVHACILQFQRVGKHPLGYTKWSELVAEYPCMILGLRDYNKEFYRYHLFYAELETYHRCGPEFLPVLARMSLEDAITTGIISE